MASRFFRVHPDLGVEEREDEFLGAPHARELSAEWLALSEPEQQLRLRDVRRALLERAERQGDARVTVVARDDPALVAELRAQPDRFEEIAAGSFAGALDAAAVELLSARTPLPRVHVTSRRHRWLRCDGDDPSIAGVWIDPSQAPALQAEIADAWWGPAQERRAAGPQPEPAPRDGGRVSRRTRARVHTTLDRFLGRFAGVLVAGGFSWLLADTWTNAFVALVVGLAVLLTLSDAVEGWYERS